MADIRAQAAGFAETAPAISSDLVKSQPGYWTLPYKRPYRLHFARGSSEQIIRKVS